MIVDYSTVYPRHQQIDQRLTDWARWVRDKPAGTETNPMFRMYRSKRQYDVDPHIAVPLNMHECLAVERAVSRIPEPHRTAIRWIYVWPWIPNNKVRQHLGTSRQGLGDLLHQGRDMVVNQLKRAGEPCC